jgi:hypothetical protein
MTASEILLIDEVFKQMLHPECHTKIHSLDLCMESAL